MKSTAIAKFSYDALHMILDITFISGERYHYKAVPEKIYLDMKSSASKGTYFNQHVKDQFDFEHITSG